MRHISKYIFPLFILLIIIGGCDDQEFLTSEQQTSVGSTGDWTSMQDLENLVIGAYWMTSGEVYGDNQQVYGRLARDMTTDIPVVFNDAGGGYYWGSSDDEVFYYRNPNNPELGTLKKIWQSCYYTIGNCNDGIDFIENEEKMDDPNNWYPRLEGEFRFLRAFNFYILSKTFAPPYSENNKSKKAIPVRKSPVKGFDDASTPRGTVDELYTLMVNDLERAIEVLPETPEDGGNHPNQYNYSRVTKSGAEFLLARIYFQMQQWGKAKDLATSVIEDPKFDLSEDPIEAWNKDTYTRPNEVIWYYQWVAGDGVGHGSNWKFPKAWNVWNATQASWGNTGTLQNTQKYIACSYSFLEKVNWIDNVNDKNETSNALNDLRYLQLYYRFEELGDTTKPRSEYVDSIPIHGGTDTIAHHVAPDTILGLDRPAVWGNKYIRSEGHPPTTNVPLLRLPEMYLTRAIISYLGGNGATQDQGQALSDVNAVRTRAGLEPLEASELTEEAIHEERMKEFAFEGDRLPYLQALRMDIPGGDREDGSVAWDSEKLVFPIPTNETDYSNAID
jgi:hypothetical protein